ncbi:thioesterase II family protein [Brevibacillus porteri]|uniref:thioesterase II family protein n=1 Tax=Brevibacillus porteri TaxID=2126350 RepID=UPI003D22A68A
MHIRERTGRWIRPDKHPKNGTYRCICLPHAGASIALFSRWKHAIGDDMDVSSVQYPGRAGHPFRVDLPATMENWVGEMIEELLPSLNSSFLLFGHSLGGILAYELAWSLVKKGKSPVALIVSGAVPPHLVGSRLRRVSALSDEQLIHHVSEYGGTPKELLAHPEFIEYFLPLFRQDIGVLDAYLYNERDLLDIPILTLAGTDDAIAPIRDIEEWQMYTSALFTIDTIEGNHFFVEDQEAVCTKIREWMDKGGIGNGSA